MQLVAYGAQDIYLTGNPQITFFKVVYRRHTNFSMETIEQTINGAVNVNGSSTVTISRNGDLVHKVYVTGGATTAATTNGSAIISEVELEIGGQRIDRHYEEWNQVWNELSTSESKAIGLKSMVGDIGTSGASATTGVKMTQYPLNFWFCRNPGLALPLIALQYHEVKLKFTWGTTAAKGVDDSIKVMCDYIYLDTDERRRFAQVSHEYLIEQLQRQAFGDTTSEKLNFNHPVKELVWTSQASSGYTTAQLKLNGHDRFSAQNAEYFQLRQPYDYHTAVPAQNLPSAVGIDRLSDDTFTDILTKSTLAGEDRAFATATAVGTGGVQVAKVTGETVVNGALSTTAATFANTDTSMTTANTVYAVTTADLLVASLSANDIVLLTVSGTDSFHQAATLSNIITTVRSKTDGSALTNVNTVDTILQFNTLLIDNGGEITTAFNIHTIKKLASTAARTSQLLKKINVYSFALKPEEHQPSGTCNFSRIDNAKLDFTGTQPTTSEYIYAVNYNVLRIMSGMGGLAYSN